MSEKNPWFERGEPARPTDIKSDKADLDMRLERKALAEGWDRTADKLDAAQSELAALREELAQTKRTAITEILALNSTLNNQAKELAQHDSFEELYNAAIDERDVLREELETARDTLVGSDAVVGFLRFKDARRRKMNTELRQRLADAERRNAELVELLRETRELVRPTAVLSPGGEFAQLKSRLDKSLLHYLAPAHAERIPGCADAGWLLYDKGLYGQHGVLVMDAATILQKATSYAGYRAAPNPKSNPKPEAASHDE